MNKKITFKIKYKWNSLYKNMAISAICKPLSMIISYIYVPIVLNYLGIEKYGVWATILAILSWISYFDLGIGNGLRNKLTEAISKKELDKQRKLVSSAYAFVAITMLGVVVLFCTVAMKINWERVFGVENLTENLYVIVCASVMVVAINFVLSICKNIFYAMQKAADVSLMELITQILNVFGILIARKLWPANLFIMLLSYGLSMGITNVIFSIILYLKNKEIIPKIKYVDWIEGKELTGIGVQFLLVQICNLVLFTTDNILISYLYGASDVTPYSTVNKLFTAISNIYIAFLAPIWTATTKAKLENRWNDIRSIIKKLIILMVPFSIIAIILVLMFRNISQWWLQQELNYSSVLIFEGCVYCILIMWNNAFCNIAYGLELLKVSLIVSSIQAVINLPLSVFFAKTVNMESAGIMLGTICSMGIAALVIPCAVYQFINKKNRTERE